MPLMKIDLLKGRSNTEIKSILDIGYQVARETLLIPEGDRYQVVTQHGKGEIILEDTGLGFQRSDKFLLFSITSRPRTREQKVNFYKRLVERLNKELGLDPKDVMVNFTINTDDDWSFGFGRAQFLTGEL